MYYETSIHVDETAGNIWRVLAAVDRWPQWTQTTRSVELLDGSPFQKGSRARIKQPRLTPLVWTVTEFDPPRSFTWQAHSPGLTVIGEHRLTPAPSGGTQVTLSIRQTGPLASIISLLFGGLTRSYVNLEAASLKRECESPDGNAIGLHT